MAALGFTYYGIGRAPAPIPAAIANGPSDHSRGDHPELDHHPDDRIQDRSTPRRGGPAISDATAMASGGTVFPADRVAEDVPSKPGRRLDDPGHRLRTRARLQRAVAAIARRPGGRYIGVEPTRRSLGDHFDETHCTCSRTPPIEPNSVDLAFTVMVLEHLPPAGVLGELQAALRRGGVFWTMTVDGRHPFARASRWADRADAYPTCPRAVDGRRLPSLARSRRVRRQRSRVDDQRVDNRDELEARRGRDRRSSRSGPYSRSTVNQGSRDDPRRPPRFPGRSPKPIVFLGSCR